MKTVGRATPTSRSPGTGTEPAPVPPPAHCPLRSLSPRVAAGTVPPPATPPRPRSPSACPVPVRPSATGILSAAYTRDRPSDHEAVSSADRPNTRVHTTRLATVVVDVHGPDSGAIAWATWWRLPAIGVPVPMWRRCGGTAAPRLFGEVAGHAPEERLVRWHGEGHVRPHLKPRLDRP